MRKTRLERQRRVERALTDIEQGVAVLRVELGLSDVETSADRQERSRRHLSCALRPDSDD